MLLTSRLFTFKVLVILILSLFAGKIQSAVAQEVKLDFSRTGLWSVMMDFVVEGNYVYCAMINGVMILDITDPEEPELLSQLFINDIAWDIAFHRDHLYIATRESGLKIISVVSPYSPTIVSSFTFDSHPQGITTSGDYAFVTTLTSLNVLDISKPSHSKLVGNLSVPEFIYIQTIELSACESLFVCGSRASLDL